MCGCNRGAGGVGGVGGNAVQGYAISNRALGRRVVQVRSIPQQIQAAPVPVPVPVPQVRPQAVFRQQVRIIRQPRNVRYQPPQQQPQPQTQPQSLYNADTAVWGANMWTVLHTLAAFSTSTSWPDLLQMLTTTIPCEICRNHFTAYLAAHPLDTLDTLDPQNPMNKITVVTWLFNLHNDVNLRIGKPLFPEVNLPQDISLMANMPSIIQNLSISFPPEVLTLLTEMSV